MDEKPKTAMSTLSECAQESRIRNINRRAMANAMNNAFRLRRDFDFRQLWLEFLFMHEKAKRDERDDVPHKWKRWTPKLWMILIMFVVNYLHFSLQLHKLWRRNWVKNENEVMTLRLMKIAVTMNDSTRPNENDKQENTRIFDAEQDAVNLFVVYPMDAFTISLFAWNFLFITRISIPFPFQFILFWLLNLLFWDKVNATVESQLKANKDEDEKWK